MEAIDLLSTRRSVVVQKLSEPGPNKEELANIIEVGMRVPDHGKIGPWRIQIITDKGKRQLGDIFADEFKKEHGERSTDTMLEFERNRPHRAPVLLVVTSKIQLLHKIPEIEQRLSGGALCMNILNASHALGFSAQWLTEWVAYNLPIKQALGHDSFTDIIGMIYIGTSFEEPNKRERPSMEMIVSEWTSS
jgi:nitroreductase